VKPRAAPTLSVLLLLLPQLAAAQEVVDSPAGKALQLRPKNITFESPAAPRRAPFLASVADPALDFVPRGDDERLRQSRSSCDRPGQSLCYDPGSGKIVYKKARELMPGLPGFRAEHISLRRDRVTFKYTFQ
jgi:hypothetical protein